MGERRRSLLAPRLESGHRLLVGSTARGAPNRSLFYVAAAAAAAAAATATDAAAALQQVKQMLRYRITWLCTGTTSKSEDHKRGLHEISCVLLPAASNQPRPHLSAASGRPSAEPGVTIFGRFQPFLRGVLVGTAAVAPLLAPALFFLGCSDLDNDEMAAAAAVAADRLRLGALETTSLSPGAPATVASAAVVAPPALAVGLFVFRCDLVPVVFAVVFRALLGAVAGSADGGASFGGRCCCLLAASLDPAAPVVCRRMADSSLLFLQPPFLRLSLKATLNRELSEWSTSTTAASRAGLPGLLAMTGSPTRNMPPSLEQESG